MKDLSKFLIFVITILGISIVVFNNLSQIIKEIFMPDFNLSLWAGFGMLVLIITSYAVINKKMLR